MIITEPDINVGIVSAEKILFCLNGDFSSINNEDFSTNNEDPSINNEDPSSTNNGNFPPINNAACGSESIIGSINGNVSGMQKAELSDGMISWRGGRYSQLVFVPTDVASHSFTLENVTIGIGFHWERHERQRFRGALKIVVDGGMLVAINIVGVEEYLKSVISSEMSATSSIELLKAHAVISRSWLLSQIEQKGKCGNGNSGMIQNEDEIIRWYDRETHRLFDVCADDHCQRYQGITRTTTSAAAEAVSATCGEVLYSDNAICDARFSKCCGGAFERFEYCWEDVPHTYLSSGLDTDSHKDNTGNVLPDDSNPLELPDLTNEAEAERWIRGCPEAFCNTHNRHTLAQVLNGYDQETSDFYRWRVEYTQKELAELIRRRSGTDFGDIIDLRPVARGVSGRLWKLMIVGSKRSMIIGKELEIRRTLSPSHLYSSAFVVDREEPDASGVPARFILTGAGWGHGVGLCQIGAAVMSERGYGYTDILKHYYHNAEIKKLYIHL